VWVFSWSIFWAFLAAILVRDVLAFFFGLVSGANATLKEMGKQMGNRQG
jgi:hypothetical protein